MSSRKNILSPFHALKAGDMSEASLVSEITNASYQDNIGIQIKWVSADAIGTIKVEASINYDKDKNTGDFVELSFDPLLSQPNSSNGSYLISLNQFPYVFYRVTYTKVSGTGTLDVWFCSKEV